MREGWTYKRLGEVCESDLGKTLNSSKDTGELRPYLCAINILWDKIDITTLKQTRFEDSELERYTVRKGDLLICEGGDIGRAAIWDKDYSIQYQNALHRVRFTDSVAPRFCLYFFMHLKKSGILDRRYGKGITIKHLVKSSLMSIPFPVAPIENQQAIVAELDKINELIGLKKSQLSDLDSLAQSIFYEMFGDPVENEKGWEVKKMEDICTNIVDCPHSTPRKSDSVTDYPCIRTSELKGGAISWDTMQYLEKEEYEIRIARLKPEAGDIVFGREGTIGDAVILPKGYNFSLGQRTMLLRANTEIISNIFLHRVILSEWIKQQIEYVNVSSTVAHVNIKDFKQFAVPLPPLPLQQSFAAQITAIEQQKQRITASIKDLETLLASRMQYWLD